VPAVSVYGWLISTVDGTAATGSADALDVDEAVTRVLDAASQRRASDSLRSG
jgi:hypothetical protein